MTASACSSPVSPDAVAASVCRELLARFSAS